MPSKRVRDCQPSRRPIQPSRAAAGLLPGASGAGHPAAAPEAVPADGDGPRDASTSGALGGPAGGTAPAAAVAARGRKRKGASSPAAAGSAAAATAPSGTDIAQATATASGRRGKRATPGGTSTPEADKRPAKRQQQATAAPLVRPRGEQRGAAAPRPRPRFPTVRLRERLRRRRCRRLCCCRGGRGAARSSQAEYEEEGSAAWKTKGASARPAPSRLPRPKRAAGKAAYQLQRERWRRQRPRRPPPSAGRSLQPPAAPWGDLRGADGPAARGRVPRERCGTRPESRRRALCAGSGNGDVGCAHTRRLLVDKVNVISPSQSEVTRCALQTSPVRDTARTTGAHDRRDTAHRLEQWAAHTATGPQRTVPSPLRLALAACAPRGPQSSRPSQPHRITDRRPPPLRTGRAAVLPLRGVAGSVADERGSEAGRGREWS